MLQQVGMDRESYRPTRDLDLLGYGDNSAEGLHNLFVSLCTLDVEPDALVFDPATIQMTQIREAEEYPGQRIRMRAIISSGYLLNLSAAPDR